MSQDRLKRCLGEDGPRRRDQPTCEDIEGDNNNHCSPHKTSLLPEPLTKTDPGWPWCGGLSQRVCHLRLLSSLRSFYSPLVESPSYLFPKKRKKIFWQSVNDKPHGSRKESWRSSFFNLCHLSSKSGRFIWRSGNHNSTKHTATPALRGNSPQ